MARNLYRCYLYIVYIALLIFAATAVGWLLTVLLAQTPLRGPDSGAPAQAEVVQSVVFAIISLVIASVLGGLHYWLIRRDIQSDPAAGGSAIRSFFLNITEAIGISLAVPIAGFLVVSALGQLPAFDIVPYAAFAIPTLALVVLLEVERRRTQVSSGAAMAFQRLHFFVVQVVFLFSVTDAWLENIKQLVDGLFFAGKGALESCNAGYGCPTFNPVGLVATLVWFLAFWIGYGWLLRNDKSPFLRLILHYASFAYGVGFIITGIYRGVQLLVLPLFHATPALKDILGSYAPYDFVSPLTFGILVVGVYHFWLSTAMKQGLIDRIGMFLTEYAVATILLAGTFWWGCGYILLNFIQKLSPVPDAPDAGQWTSAIALVVAGISYIPLDLYLRRRQAIEPSSATGPHRGFVLALLGGGMLAFAIGGVVALYAWVTALFGSPVYNWELVSRTGLVAFIVGAIVLGIYLWTALREHLFSSFVKRPIAIPDLAEAGSSGIVPATPDASTVAPTKPATIESVLDELIAGTITRDEAVVRIHALEHA